MLMSVTATCMYQCFDLLQLDGAGSSDEVCPLLLPPPTSTDDYIQPVVIDRDLELITRNLPEPPVSTTMVTYTYSMYEYRMWSNCPPPN